MKRNWKQGLIWIVAGLCCSATVAEVDAGIIFRRGSRNGVTTTQSTTNVTRGRRGILGRRRGTEATSSQVTTTTSPGMTVRGQTPDNATPATGASPAAPTR
jgi:hypothetical protein